MRFGAGDWAADLGNGERGAGLDWPERIKRCDCGEVMGDLIGDPRGALPVKLEVMRVRQTGPSDGWAHSSASRGPFVDDLGREAKRVVSFQGASLGLEVVPECSRFTVSSSGFLVRIVKVPSIGLPFAPDLDLVCPLGSTFCVSLIPQRKRKHCGATCWTTTNSCDGFRTDSRCPG